VDALEALARDNPKRIERRVKNRLLGRALGPGWLVALALEVTTPRAPRVLPVHSAAPPP
jgi:hypothetical protein